MKTAGKVVLVTGANRGLGRALVEEALKSGATKVYAGTRSPLPYSDDRVASLILDVTSRKEIRKAADKVESLDLLINNAGIAFPDDLSVRSAIERHLAVKLFGMNDVTQAFLPMLIRSQGAVANILSRAALAPLPFIPAYSISDAAAFSLTLSLRRLLAARGVRVHAIMPGSIDTDMSRGFDVPGKSTPTAVAREILSAIERGDEEIFPDPMSVPLAKNWRLSPTKELERQFGALARNDPGADDLPPDPRFSRQHEGTELSARLGADIEIGKRTRPQWSMLQDGLQGDETSCCAFSDLEIELMGFNLVAGPIADEMLRGGRDRSS